MTFAATCAPKNMASSKPALCAVVIRPDTPAAPAPPLAAPPVWEDAPAAPEPLAPAGPVDPAAAAAAAAAPALNSGKYSGAFKVLTDIGVWEVLGPRGCAGSLGFTTTEVGLLCAVVAATRYGFGVFTFAGVLVPPEATGVASELGRSVVKIVPVEGERRYLWVMVEMSA